MKPNSDGEPLFAFLGIIVIAIIAIIVGPMLWKQHQEEKRRRAAIKNLQQLSKALTSYTESYGDFLPDHMLTEDAVPFDMPDPTESVEEGPSSPD